MSDKQNFAKSIIDAWQDSIQSLIKDRQFVDLIVDNYAKFQEIVKTTVPNDNFQHAAARDDADKSNDLQHVRAELAALEQRISALEKTAAASADGKSDSAKKPQ